MKKPSPIQTIVLSLLLASCASAPAAVDPQPDGPVFALTVKNTEDQVSIQHSNGTALIDITSPSGIGSAVFELESGIMPANVILRLHLKGLEDFRLTSAQVGIGASVSSGGQPNIGQKISSSGTVSPMLPGNPLWMEIDIVSEREQETIPLEEGYFEITVPKEFLQKAGTSFTVEWIDFYR